MSRQTSLVGGLLMSTALGMAVAGPALAEDKQDVLQEIRKIRDEISRQQSTLLQQQQRLWRLEQQLITEGLVTASELEALRGLGAGDQQLAQADDQATAAPDQPVGEAADRQRPEVSALQDVGGVLTPRGRIVFEPQIEYSHSSVSRFFFSGVQIVDAVLIGAIEAVDAERDTFTYALAGRYGITNRLEADVRVPWVFRDDSESDPLDTGSGLSRDLEGDGIGDIEAGLHYQLNDGAGGWPFFVGNLRVKSDTGEGPFDVRFDDQGRQLELATGSGYWGIEPSVTVLYPTDPVVLFGNLGYAFNLETDVDKQIGGDTFGTVDPGDSLSVSFGMGFGINPNFSVSFGYEHSYVFATESEVNGVTAESDELQVGSFLFGMALGITDQFNTNLNVAIGATEDAPDVRISLRTPVSFDFLR